MRTYLFGKGVTDAGVDSVRFIDVQKVLYLLQKEADSTSSIADLWDFYWYLHGPMAAGVSQASTFAIDRWIVTFAERGGGETSVQVRGR